MKNKKKASVVTVAALMLLAVIGGAYAYFSGQSEIVNNNFVADEYWTYSISFDGNGADSGEMETIDGVKQVIGLNGELPSKYHPMYATELPANDYVRAGYKFAGWSLTPVDASGEVNEPVYPESAYVSAWHESDNIIYKSLEGKNFIADKATVQNLSSEHKDITLYAVWDLDQYTVHYDANSENYNNVNFLGHTDDQIITFYDYTKKDVYLNENGFTFPEVEDVNGNERVVYTFLGWDRDPKATTPTYPADNLKLTADVAEHGEAEVTLYAVWSSPDDWTPTDKPDSDNDDVVDDEITEDTPVVLKEGYYRITVISDDGENASYEHRHFEADNIYKEWDGEEGHYIDGLFYVADGTIVYKRSVAGESGTHYFVRGVANGDYTITISTEKPVER